MKIFLSWSGPASHQLALALKDWLPSVLPFADPWVSSEDIPKGKRWGREVDDMLEKTSFCIVCLTPGNTSAPWINFEAGAIAKVVDGSHVSPLLLGLEPTDLAGHPLAMFQATRFEKSDMLRLLRSINTASGTPIPDDRLTKNFSFSWNALGEAIGGISPDPPEERPAKDGAPAEDLSDSEKQIVAYVVVHSQTFPGVSVIARAVGESEVKTEYYLDKLERLKLVHALYSTIAPVRFMTTEEGRAYAVEKGLVS